MGKLKPHKFSELLPLMSEPEYQALKSDVAARLARKQPPFTDKALLFEGQILDGRNRYRVANELKIKFPAEKFKGSAADAINHVYSKAVHRNMDLSQKACAAVNFLDHFEKEAFSRMKSGGSQKIDEGQKGRATEKAGELFGVNRQYVSDAKLIREKNLKLFQEVFTGRLALSRAKTQLRRDHKKVTHGEAAKPIALSDDTCTLLVGDNRKKLDVVKNRSVELIFTDPPYGIGEQYNSFNDNLSRAQLMKIIRGAADHFPRILTPTGSVFMMMSSRYAEDVGQILREVGLHRQDMIIWAESFGSYNPRFWTDSYRVIHHYTATPTFTFNADAPSVLIPSVRNEAGDKRQIVGGKLPGNVWGVWTDREVARLVGNAAERIPDKRAVNQLPVKLVERIVRIASNPGDLVVDPFHGTGTTARAALANARRYLGCDVDGEMVKASKGWIKSYLAGRQGS